MKIVVTGGSGKAGRAVVRDLAAHGYDVINADRVPPAVDLPAPFRQVELSEMGQAFEMLVGADAVVHLAAIPAPNRFTPEVTFRSNMAGTYNVFNAALQLGLKRVVWASSETVLGLPFDRQPPPYAPIDEEALPSPESSYALCKLLSEEMARQLNRWSGIPFIGLRFSNIMEIERYRQFPTFWGDARLRKWNLWSYVDVRDVAQSCRLGLEADITGAEVFIIAAADTVMTRTNGQLMAEIFPNVPLRPGTGDFETLESIAKARRLLGYHPQHSWRDHLTI